jgi:hypothetical protein
LAEMHRMPLLWMIISFSCHFISDQHHGGLFAAPAQTPGSS